MMSQRTLALLLPVAALLVLVACADGNDDSEPVEPTPTAAETPAETPVVRTDNEFGEAPIFWRAEDEFASIRPNEPYKVLFRITGGFAEEQLAMVVIHQESGDEIAIESNLAEPVGEEAPGSYYPTFLDLPEPGTWDLTVTAGEDETTIEIAVPEPNA